MSDQMRIGVTIQKVPEARRQLAAANRRLKEVLERNRVALEAAKETKAEAKGAEVALQEAVDASLAEPDSDALERDMFKAKAYFKEAQERAEAAAKAAAEGRAVVKEAKRARRVALDELEIAEGR